MLLMHRVKSFLAKSYFFIYVLDDSTFLKLSEIQLEYIYCLTTIACLEKNISNNVSVLEEFIPNI